MLNKEKGITLIALIITIIVMLILVGVTINVALNGGLFHKAETATKQTEKAVEEEQLMAAIVTAYNEKTGVVEKTTLQTELTKQGAWQVSGEGPYGVISPKGNEYTVTKDGKIAKGWVDNGDGSYTKGNTTVKVGETTYTTAEVLEKLGIAPSEGKYNGNWLVIGVEKEKIKLVSEKNVIGGLTSGVKLGTTDPRAYEKDSEGNGTTIKPEVKDYNSDKTIGEYDVAVWSYAHAIETLNKEAKEITGIASARSITVEDIYGIIGEENITKDEAASTYGEIYNYYFNGQTVYSESKKYGKYNTNKETQTFVKYPDNIEENTIGDIIQVNLENSNTNVELTCNLYNYTLTPEQKAAVGSLATDSYWLASPYTFVDPNVAIFYIPVMFQGRINTGPFFYSNGGLNSGVAKGVRAVVYI